MYGADLEWAPIPPGACNIPLTLASGQSFRWKRAGDDWLGVITGTAVRLRPVENGFWWQTYPAGGQWSRIFDYFALDVDLERISSGWSESEPRILPALQAFSGLRILRQDPEEAFFSFLCASCNTITKITRTIHALEKRAGIPLVQLEGQTLYRFPSAGAIAELDESDLRADLWGYRAPRLIQLARFIVQQGPGWLASLRRIPYREAHYELAGLFGIGAKLADCICLFGLGHDEAVPVDTHIRQIAIEMFRPDLGSRSLTPSVYWTLGDLFREKFGPYAGWAQQYLFMQHVTRNTKNENTKNEIRSSPNT